MTESNDDVRVIGALLRRRPDSMMGAQTLMESYVEALGSVYPDPHCHSDLRRIRGRFAFIWVYAENSRHPVSLFGQDSRISRKSKLATYHSQSS